MLSPRSVRSCGCPKMIFRTYPRVAPKMIFRTYPSPPLVFLRDIHTKILATVTVSGNSGKILGVYVTLARRTVLSPLEVTVSSQCRDTWWTQLGVWEQQETSSLILPQLNHLNENSTTSMRP